MEQYLRGTPDGHLDHTADRPGRDPRDRGSGPSPVEDLPYDDGGWLRPGTIVIPASTMRPVPELTPEQVQAYERIMRRAYPEES